MTRVFNFLNPVFGSCNIVKETELSLLLGSTTPSIPFVSQTNKTTHYQTTTISACGALLHLAFHPPTQLHGFYNSTVLLSFD
jgi:hypothetical protein